VAKSPQKSVAKSKGTTDESHCDGEDNVLHASRENFLAVSRYSPYHGPTHDNTAELRRIRLARLLDSSRLSGPPSPFQGRELC
jgi:hypothetical protein